MKLIQRVPNGEKYYDYFLRAAEKYPDSFTDVWLSTSYGYPKLSDHFKTADRLGKVAKAFREKGIRVSLQISNTIGHGQYILYEDCSGLVFEGSPVKNIVGAEGEVAKYAFCWNDPYFRSYGKEYIKRYVEAISPDEIWIDDDLRGRHHAPVEYGCFCDDCMARFNSLHGTDYDRETLKNEFLHGDISVREKWIQFVRDGLADFTEDLCRAIHETNPDTVVCLQNGENRSYTGHGLGFLLDAMYKTTTHAPMYRAGGGTYTDHDPNKVVRKMVVIDLQHSMLPDYVVERCPEIECLPDNTMGKTMYAHALETALYLAAGATGMSYAMVGDMDEPDEFYLRGMELFASQRRYYDMLSEASKKTVCGGITFAKSKLAHLRKMPENAVMSDFFDEKYDGGTRHLRSGFPLSFEERANGVYMLHPDTAKQMQKCELDELLSKNVMTDVETVLYMKSQGLDLGVDGERISLEEGLTMTEKYTDHEVNRVERSSYKASFFSSGFDAPNKITALPENSEVLGIFEFKLPQRIYDIENAPHGYASAVIHTEKGGKWAVMGHSLWKPVIPAYQRDRILNIIDYISDKAPAARMMSPTQDILLPRISKDDGKTVSVSVLNCTIEPQSDVKLAIRRPIGKKLRFVSQYDGEFDLEYEEKDGELLVTLPKLTPWAIGTVFCE